MLKKYRLIPLLAFVLWMAIYLLGATEFGFTGIGGTSDGQNQGVITGGIFTLSENGDVSKITAHCAYSTATNGKCAIYSVSAGEPNALQGSTNATAFGTPNQWTDFTFAAPLALTAGDYFLCLFGDNAYSIKYNVTGTGFEDGGNTYDTFPATWDTAGDAVKDRIYSIYATYAASGSGSTPTVIIIN